MHLLSVLIYTLSLQMHFLAMQKYVLLLQMYNAAFSMYVQAAEWHIPKHFDGSFHHSIRCRTNIFRPRMYSINLGLVCVNLTLVFEN